MLMVIILKYIWIFFILITCINAFKFRQKAEEYIKIDPELKKSYDKLYKYYLIMGNIPWAIIGIGIISGATKYVFDFFVPIQLNPVVLLFHGIVITFWVLGSYWIYIRNGADFLTKYPAFFDLGDSTKKNYKIRVKFFWGLMMLGGIFAEIMMWHIQSPLRFTNI